MKLPRRTFLRLATGAAALPALPHVARAQSYPSRSVRIIVGAAPGGPPDIGARMIGQWLSDRLGQPFIVENRPGAGTNIGTEAVSRAPADGYTLLLTTASAAWNATLYRKLNFNFLRDIAPVASVYRQTGVMDVSPSFPAKTVAEFISYAKANPGKINMASTGNGSATHIYGELFKLMAGTDVVHVPYRGNPLALTALMSGEAHVFFELAVVVNRAYQGRQIARAGGDHRDAFAIVAGSPDGRRFRSRLRGERVARCRRSQEHTCRDH